MTLFSLGMAGGLEVQKHWRERYGSEEGHWLGPGVQRHEVSKHHFFFFLLAVRLVSFEILFLVNTNVAETPS